MPREPAPEVHGILNLNKPAGPTSMDMVRLVKRLTRVRHVGHGGTLDPGATGVLPICFGQATRAMEYLIQGRKVYQARMCLGVSTDTYDAQGRVTEQRDPSGVTRQQLGEALPRFTGLIEQQPPMYSALKHKGKRLYELARAGVEVARETRRVQVHRLEMVAWDPPFAGLLVECGRGLFMRSLVHDVGQALGCGAHLDSLVRMQAGPFRVEDSVTPEQFQEAVEGGTWESLLQAPDVVLLHLVAMRVDARAERSLRNGQPAMLDPRTHYASHMECRRAYGPDSRFIGVVRFNKGKGLWQPDKVFRLSAPSPHAPGRAEQA